MTINEAIKTYLEQQARAAEARKQADAAKRVIMAHAGDADEFKTDLFIVYIKRTPSIRLDTDALYRDFPDIKETYGKASVSRSIDAHPLPAADGRTA